MRNTPEKVFNKLVDMASYRAYAHAMPDRYLIERAIMKGEDIPEMSKPGALVHLLSETERKISGGLTAKMTDHRLF